jgi:Tol biopolymer transport system component
MFKNTLFLFPGLFVLLMYVQSPAQSVRQYSQDLQSPAVEFSLTLTPDGKTAYFVRTDSFYVSKPRTIYKSQKKDGQWPPPEPAPFSGQYSDSSPFVSPDGARLFFTSRRPAGGALDGSSNIWYVPLIDGQEGEPVLLEGVNSEKSEYSPTVDAQGNLYFGSYREGGQGWGDIWMAKWDNGAYSVAQNLGPTINTSQGEWGSCIAPDGTYLIFESSGREDGLSPAGDLYISFYKEGTWQKPLHFDPPVNSIGSDLTPRIHGDTLYFASNRPTEEYQGFDNNNVALYYISLADLLSDR